MPSFNESNVAENDDFEDAVLNKLRLLEEQLEEVKSRTNSVQNDFSSR
jgi:hypothetical protein